MGYVTAVHPGSDGLIRNVTLRTQKGQLRRPIQRIHNLEIRERVQPSATHDVIATKETQRGQISENKDDEENLVMQKVVDLPREDQAGEDVQYRTRAGRVVIPTQKLGVFPTPKQRLRKQRTSQRT